MSKPIFSETVLQFMAPIRDYLEDDAISEIMINGHENIYIEKGGKLHKTDRRFHNEAALIAAMRNVGQFTGRQITPLTHQIDARLPDQSRVQILFKPCANTGPYMAIRKFLNKLLSLEDLITYGSLNHDMYKLIRSCVGVHKNIVVSGGTSSGKTTFLNLISGFIDDQERIITIEDVCELQIGKDHVVTMETRKPDPHGRGEVTIRDLLVISLRMRPDRIIIGECRAGETLDMLQAMNTGHSGSMTTLHANSAKDALSRMETMALMSGVDMPLVAVRSQVASAISMVIQISRMGDGSRKVIDIAEVLDLDADGNYQTRSIYNYKAHGRNEESGKIEGEHLYTGYQPSFMHDLELSGFELPEKMAS
ncbi:CpaF family protein [Desulfogranum japonicum]|uniref:CpaF family protein n=1 Tax=Desulfogranum japonicum TaxID=231447 RepID=UPI0003FAAC20|nr:CpaF family protein [Desulfogranum japonicum]